MLLVPQTAAATWRVLCALVCLLFPLVLSLTLFQVVVVLFFLFFFFQLVLFKCLSHSLRGGTTVCYFYLFIFCFFLLFLFRFVFFVFVFVFVSFRVSISYNVCVVPIVSSMMTWHRIAHCAYCIRGNVVYVAT